jgi:hypothetical protein
MPRPARSFSPYVGREVYTLSYAYPGVAVVKIAVRQAQRRSMP